MDKMIHGLNKNYGLKPTPKDKRDFRLGQIIRWPSLDELPKSFELPVLSVKDQRDTDFCTAFATCGMSEIQEGVELNPYWSFAVSKIISGDPERWGQDIRTAMKSHVKFGALPESEAVSISVNDVRDIKKWPNELWPPVEEAEEHRKQSYFAIEDWPRDWTASDAIKAAIWLFRAKNKGVGIGVVWNWPVSIKRITEWSDRGSGHMMWVRGWDESGFLIVQNSLGKSAGDKGSHHISPVVINKGVKRFGAYMFVDVDPNEARGICWSWWRRLCQFIIKLFS